MLVAMSLTKWFDWTLIMPRPQYSGRALSMPGLGALAPCVAGTATCMVLFLYYECSMNKAFPLTAPSQCYEITECNHIFHVFRSQKHNHEFSPGTNQTLNLKFHFFPRVCFYIRYNRQCSAKGAYIQCLSNGVMTLCIKPSGCLLVKTYILHTFTLRVDLIMLLWNTKLGKLINVTFCLLQMKHFRMNGNIIWFWYSTNTPVSLQNFVIITISECSFLITLQSYTKECHIVYWSRNGAAIGYVPNGRLVDCFFLY